LKSTSIIGGSQVLNYGIGLIRTKVVALLLGPAGIGLIGIYNSILGVASTASELGLRNSGVREIANAIGTGDRERVGQVTLAIRRLAILLGVFAALIMALAAPLISQLVFNDIGYAGPIALLSVILILKGVNHSQKALIQGNRRINELAKLTIISAIGSTVVAIVCYGIWGEQAIAPVLIMISAVTVGASAFYARKLLIHPEENSWRGSVGLWRKLIGLGVAIAWGALLAVLVPFIVRAVIVRDLGIDANGLYMSAWAISGMFVQFILKAMSADFFPRLSAASEDQVEINRLVNEQTEIGILIAFPVVLGATIYAPVLIRLLYSSEFAVAATLMPWFLLGVLGRVVSWPMGMIVLAKGHSKTFAVMQSLSAPLHVLQVLVCFHFFGLVGAAIGFGLHNIFYNVAMWLFLRLRYGFRWTPQVECLLLGALVFFLGQAVLALLFEGTVLFWTLATAWLIGAGFVALRGLVNRMSGAPKVDRLLARLPFNARRLLGA
jgi:PST family polysaccharide transporter